VLLARSKNKKTNKSVIYDYKTTALLKSQELLAYNLTRLWLKDYYLTYPGMTVEDEVKSVLKNHSNFLHGNLPVIRDSENNFKPGFVVKDRNYLSARWPGDVYKFSNEYLKLIT
jgi:protease I